MIPQLFKKEKDNNLTKQDYFMELQRVLKKRHSIRSFQKRNVPKTVLIDLVKDAIQAPSSQNDQPWEFTVLRSKKIRDKIASMMAKDLIAYKKDFDSLEPKVRKEGLEFYKNLGDCPNIIFVFTEKLKSRYRMESNIMGISAAVENLMLSSVNKGLGTCWIGGMRGFQHQKEIKKLIGVGSNKSLIASILIGYPKKDYKPLVRSKKKLNDVLRFV